MASPQEPEEKPGHDRRPVSAKELPKHIQGKFRTPDELKEILRRNPERYPHVIEVPGGTGFAVKDQLLIHLEYDDALLASVMDLEDFPARYITQLVIGGQVLNPKTDVSSQCVCLGPGTILVQKEGITDNFTEDTLLSILIDVTTPELHIKGYRPPQLIDEPKISGSHNYYIPGEAIDPASPGDWSNFFAQLTNTSSRSTLAVVDTGVQINNTPLRFWTSDAPNPCKGGPGERQIGWDFVGRDSQPDDDNAFLHGSTVSLLAREQTASASFMILKAFNHEGIAQLDRILCALWYAKKNKAHVVNLSFGYYGEDIPLFRYFLDYLGRQKIVVVAAAGNRMDFDGFPNDIGVKSFYPACYSSDLPNVLTVTTVRCVEETSCDCEESGLARLCFQLRKAFGLLKHSLVPHENFSNQFVTLGVLPAGRNGVFRNPFNSSFTVEGSSFVTPVVSGMLAEIYASNAAEILNTVPSGQLKQYYLGKLPVKTHLSLLGFIRNGAYLLQS